MQNLLSNKQMFKHIELIIENLFSKFITENLFSINKTTLVMKNNPNFLYVYFLWNLFCMTSMTRSVES